MLVFESLRSDAKVYVEYSNEVWGTLFPGGKYAQKMGLQLKLSTDPDDARFRYYFKRSNEVSRKMPTVHLRLLSNTESLAPSLCTDISHLEVGIWFSISSTGVRARFPGSQC